MKKKIINIIVILLTLLTAMINIAYAGQNAIPNANYTPGEIEIPTRVTNKFAIVAQVIQTIGIILSVIVLLLLGIKLITGSVEEKAEYKKKLIPYIVGVVFIVATGTILRLVADLTSQAGL